jgi:hypothetical protein
MSNANRASIKDCVEKIPRLAKTIHFLILRNGVGVAEASGFTLRSAQAVYFQAVGNSEGINNPGVSTRPREIPAIIEVWKAKGQRKHRQPAKG